ncbi:small integral membrane protein 20 [Motacilla alba alba]|uniref:small integral membrane protein 20 n=1 Tax=Motacilla alba alba TaxID=1094192 RepID=UPI0018D57A60|nr:small integral membrane protein 20 [Motacilla alba alba]
MLPLRRCPARQGLRGRPGDKDAADPASWRRGRRPGRAGQGRAGQGPAPPPQVRRGWARRRGVSAVLRSSSAAPRSSAQRAPGGVPGGIPAQGRARPLSWRLRGGPRPPRRSATGAVPGRDSSRCRAGRFGAGQRDWGASPRAARAGLTARRPRPRARAAPRRPRGGALPAGRAVPRAAARPGRPRRAMAALSRTLGIFGAFVAVVGAAFYPIYFRPLLLPEEYKNEQSINRAGIVQEDIQPAGLKVWSDPFGRK